ncbi:MAG: hypothetical protein KDI61_07090 [Alphaproteobacteria bacterium]|nr:hypothetical protein [Alphaproteobacteria bacterium]
MDPEKVQEGDTSVPFAYIKGTDRKSRQIWAVISAPPSQHEAIREAVKGVQERRDRIDLPSLIKAFHGQVTASGPGEVPSDIREALHLLYGEADNEQTGISLET